VQTLHKILRWFVWDFWPSRVQLLIFGHLFQFGRINFILTKRYNIYIVYVKIFHEAKLLGFCQNADDPQTNKYFPQQNDISRTE